MTALRKKIDKIAKEAGIELTHTTISKIESVTLQYIDKAWNAGMSCGADDKGSISQDQWMFEQKLQ